MYSQTHFLFPLFIGLLLYRVGIFSWKLALFAGIVGIFIDIDHYIEHIIHSKKNKFSLRATWNNSIKLHKFNQRSFIHYWDGAVILSFLFLIVSLWYPFIALALAIGYFSNLLLDVPNFAKKTILKLKIGELYFRESWVEVLFCVLLIIGCIIVLLL